MSKAKAAHTGLYTYSNGIVKAFLSIRKMLITSSAFYHVQGYTN